MLVAVIVVNDLVVYVVTGLPIDLHGKQKVVMTNFLQGQYHVTLNDKEKIFFSQRGRDNP